MPAGNCKGAMKAPRIDPGLRELVGISIAVQGAQALLNSDQLIDLLFVDVNLGGDLEAGLRIAQNARDRRPFLPVVYTTGQGRRQKGTLRRALSFSSEALYLRATHQFRRISS